MTKHTAHQLPTSVDENSRDECLMASVREGDPEALQGLIDRHWDELYGFSVRMLRDPDEAEDIAQEVFVITWQNRSRWRSEGSLRAYLFRIARNLLMHRLRHREVRARKEAEIRESASVVPTPAECVLISQGQEAFDRALAALPERRREAFTLTRVQGLSIGEAAKVMGVTPRTLTNHIYLAARELELALRPFLE